MTDLAQIDVIAPNFKKRQSGVTSTVVRLVPLQAKQIGIVTSAPNLPAHIPQVPFHALATMSRAGPSGARVWHARRNSEMLLGLLLKHFLRKRLKLLFTSASQRVHTGYTKWLVRQMDWVVATSARSAQYLEVPHEVIRHGIDTERFCPVADRAALRVKLGLNGRGPQIGCFGRIRKQKGTDVFVDAMIRILPKFPDAHAIVMGGVTQGHETFLEGLRAKIEAAGLSGRIRVLPEVPEAEVVKYFQALDIYIAPQRWEGFGLTPIEAMACGVPVIATKVGAFEELIAPNETGTLIEVGDVDAMARGASLLLADPAKRATWSKAARARTIRHFRLQGEADALIAVYHRLLGLFD